jgi:hypothetical protein
MHVVTYSSGVSKTACIVDTQVWSHVAAVLTCCGLLPLPPPLLLSRPQHSIGINMTVSCPKSMVGRVIGKGGETIKGLQRKYHTSIQVGSQVRNQGLGKGVRSCACYLVQHSLQARDS